MSSNTANAQKNMQQVICAKCSKQIPKRLWLSHNLSQHNNMAWQETEEPLDFENDIKLLRKVLTYAIKKKKNLTCEKCKATKRSANGFISHMQFCGKSEEEKQALMMTCAICNAVMMPSSMEIHERYHRQMERNKVKEVPNVQIERTKRKAAEKAMPKILGFTEYMKEPNSLTKKTKLDSAIFKDMIQAPELKKRIPAVWKGIWKKEIASRGTVTCKQLGCTYKSDSYENICEHYSQCNFNPQEDFMCKICKFTADSKDKIVSHVMESHYNEENLDKHSDFETENTISSDESIDESDTKRRKSKNMQISSDSAKSYNKPAFLTKEPSQNPNEPYKPTFRWTLEFGSKNYGLELFKDYMPNSFILLKSDDAEKYLPKLTSSMAFQCVNVNLTEKNTRVPVEKNWKRMNRFESAVYETPTFFTGGPIWALAWLPIPLPMYSKNPTQYVAISTHPTMESEYVVGKSYSESNVIQIWNIGQLNHKCSSVDKPPTLAYAIAHNSGTIWCLEWCPSGCYQDIHLDNYKAEESKFRRMGLLAAACSDGCVNIYALPFPEELKFEKTEYNSWPIYKTDPVAILVVNHLMYDNNNQDWQCSKLSWTKEHGHDIIAAGFTNGYIALWDITATSPLLLNVRNDTKFINAFKHFFAHHNAVSMVSLVPYNNKRYLASASLDRTYKFWDLEETSVPQNCSKKGIIVDGVWMIHWPCSVISFDDALKFNYTHSHIIPIREHGYKYCPILAMNAPTYGIAVSDYANSIAHGTLAGDILTIFAHQLLYPEKSLLRKGRQLNSIVKIVDFLEDKRNASSKNNETKNNTNSKEYHYMPASYNECKDRFGIIFRDNLPDLKENGRRDRRQDTLDNDKLTSLPIEQYPFTSINRMAWNPNAWSYLWLMVCYQNGLTRLLNFKSMSAYRGDELEKLLSSHAECLLAKTKPTQQL